MDRVRVASVLEDLLLLIQDREELINEAALVLKDYEDEDERAEEWIDRFIHHGLRRDGELNETISKLLKELKEGGEA